MQKEGCCNPPRMRLPVKYIPNININFFHTLVEMLHTNFKTQMRVQMNVHVIALMIVIVTLTSIVDGLPFSRTLKSKCHYLSGII